MRVRPAFGGTLFVLAMLAAPAALAAPSCLDRRGDTVRCESAGAMPVGWTPPPEQVRAHLAATGSQLDVRQTLGLICVMGGIFALFALLPDFDDGWDRQEDDCEPRG
jgi:hypothetical protein